MNEQEALDMLNDWSMGIITGISDKCLSTAMVALEEIQQYRALGNVEELREAKEKQIPKKPILKTTQSVSHVHYINKPHEMKITETEAFHCPVCDWFVGEYFKPRNHAQQKKQYCSRCGTKMDWSDWTYEKENEGKQENNATPDYRKNFMGRFEKPV